MGMNTVTSNMRSGHRLYSVGGDSPKTYVLVSPDGESSVQIDHHLFGAMVQMKIIEATGRENPLKVEYTLAWPLGGSPPVEVVPEGHSEWVEVPLSGTLCIEALPSDTPDPAPTEKQSHHVYLDK